MVFLFILHSVFCVFHILIVFVLSRVKVCLVCFDSPFAVYRIVFFLDLCCCVRSLMFIPGLLSMSLLLFLLTFVALPLSMANPTASGLHSYLGKYSYTLILSTSYVSKLKLFLVLINLSSCFLCSIFLYVFLLISCDPLVHFYFLFS